MPNAQSAAPEAEEPPQSAPRSLYPPEFEAVDGYPTTADVVVNRTDERKGLGIYALRRFERGHRICRISGVISHEIRQHTLQITPSSHLHDPWFTGYLLHSCDPNVFLDILRFELWALKDIEVGEALSMDYASTEDVLFKQFPCLCGAGNCRGWITGRREAPDAALMAAVAATPKDAQ
jgi:hypothetical protein